MAEARTVARGVHPIRQNTSFALAKVCRAHRTHVGELLAEHGLHVGQEMALVELWQDDGLRCGDLADRLGVEPPPSPGRCGAWSPVVSWSAGRTRRTPGASAFTFRGRVGNSKNPSCVAGSGPSTPYSPA